MPARLTIHFSDRPAKVFLAQDSSSYLLGRGPECEIVLDDVRVSRRHARLRLEGEQAFLEDLDSKNGIAVDGVLTREVGLPENCWLSLGGLLIQFESAAETLASEELELERRRATLHQHQTLAEPGLDVSTLVRRLLVSFLEMSGTDRGFVLLTGAQQRFDIVASKSLSAEALGEAEFSGSVSTVEQVLTGAEPLIRSDAQEHPSSSGRPSIVRDGIRALVCVPLEAAGRTIGAVYADSRRPGKTFSELDVEILEALASHAALAIWASGLKDEVEGLARELPTRISPSASNVVPVPGFPSWSEVATEHRSEDGP